MEGLRDLISMLTLPLAEGATESAAAIAALATGSDKRVAVLFIAGMARDAAPSAPVTMSGPGSVADAAAIARPRRPAASQGHAQPHQYKLKEFRIEDACTESSRPACGMCQHPEASSTPSLTWYNL